MLDLAIRHGTVATATDTFAADVGVASGVLDTVGSDHAAWTVEQK